MSTLTMRIPHRSLSLPVGIPGSGKTTLLNYLESNGDWEIRGLRFGADDVRRIVFRDVSVQGTPRLAHAAARAVLEVRMDAGLTACYDSTNLTYKARDPLLDLALQYNYTVVYLVSAVPLEVALARNTARTDGCVPNEVMARMWSQRSEPARDERRYDFWETTTALEIAWTD